MAIAALLIIKAVLSLIGMFFGVALTLMGSVFLAFSGDPEIREIRPLFLGGGACTLAFGLALFLAGAVVAAKLLFA